MHAGLKTSSGSLLYNLPSILKPIALGDLFDECKPVEVELGSGDATFLVCYAQSHPEHNFIGVERLLGRIQKLDRKGRRAGLRNIRGVRIESAYFLKYLLPSHSAVALHVYFPDPWPKRRHLKNRLVNPDFPELAAHALAPAGTVYLRTDHADYFQQMREAFGSSAIFRPVQTPKELSTLQTDFEQEFAKKGLQTLRAAYQLAG